MQLFPFFFPFFLFPLTCSASNDSSWGLRDGSSVSPNLPELHHNCTTRVRMQRGAVRQPRCIDTGRGPRDITPCPKAAHCIHVTPCAIYVTYVICDPNPAHVAFATSVERMPSESDGPPTPTRACDWHGDVPSTKLGSPVRSPHTLSVHSIRC